MMLLEGQIVVRQRDALIERGTLAARGIALQADRARREWTAVLLLQGKNACFFTRRIEIADRNLGI